MQMLRWADKRHPYCRMLIDSDLLGMEREDVIVGDYDPEEHEGTRVFDDAELREFARRLARSTLPVKAKLLMLIMVSTGKRIRETCMGEWASLNFETGEWTIPKEHAKNNRESIVYLSAFTLRLFHALRAISAGRYMFPARRHKGKKIERPITPNSISTANRDRQVTPKDYKLNAFDWDILVLDGGRWTSHDLRRTAATTMQRLGVGESIIHRCLNHTAKKAKDAAVATDSIKLGRIYLRHAYEAEMRDAWKRLGTHLEQVMAVADTMPVLMAARGSNE